MAEEKKTTTEEEVKYVVDSNEKHNRMLLREHPNFEELKKAYLKRVEAWGEYTLADLKGEVIAHLKGVSAGSVGAMRKKLTVYDCLNKMAGDRDNTSAIVEARKAQLAAEEALKAQRKAMLEMLVKQNLNPADFGFSEEDVKALS